MTRAKLFQPKDDEVSTYRVRDMNHSEIKLLGDEWYVAKQKTPKPLIGWARIVAKDVTDLNLTFDLTIDPAYPQHPRHAGIRGWPPWPSGQKMDKAREMLIFNSLAAKAIFVAV
jgi:hypothetical protein